MRKRILYFVSVVFVLFMAQSARAAVIERSEYDASGNWYLRMEYDTESHDYNVFLQDYFGPADEELVFPERFHVTFEDYDGLHNDMEDDFLWQFSETFSLTQASYGGYVKRIRFSEGVTDIPAYFYSCNRDLNAGIAEENSVLEEVIFEDEKAQDKTIGSHAFAGHSKLRLVDFGAHSPKVSVGVYAFAAPYEEEMDLGMGGGMIQNSISALSDLGEADFVSIGERAFEGCVSLKSVRLSRHLTTFGAFAFSGAGVEEVRLDGNCPFSATDAYPFSGCPVKKVAITPDASGAGKVVIVPAHLFEYLSGAPFDVVIADADKAGWEHVGFGEKCFYYSSIKSINLPKQFIASPAYPAISFGPESFKSTSLFKQELDLRLEGTPNWTEIWAGAFENSAIRRVQFGDNVFRISDDAFSGSQLTGTLTIPQYHNTATDADEPMIIGARAFSQTTKLTEVQVVSTITDGTTPNVLNDFVFAGCGATKYELNPATKVIGYMAFSGSNIERFTGWTNLSEIQQEAFGSCQKLTSVDLSATKVTGFPEQLFAYDENLTEIKFPVADNILIREYAFNGTGFTHMDVYATHLHPDAFSNMPNLESVRFVHPKMEVLTGESFSNLPKLKVMDFGENIKHITGDVLIDCPAFDSLVITANIEDISPEAFTSVESHIKKVVFKSTHFKELADGSKSPFKNFSSDLYVDEAVKNIPAYVFSNMHITNSPELRSDLSFDENTFSGSTLDSLNWHYPEETVYPFTKAVVKTLAFSNMTAIRNNFFHDAFIINLYLEGIETIGEYAFEKANIPNPGQKNRLVIPGTVKEIQRGAFKGVSCDGLVFEKGEGLTIGTAAFQLSGGVTFNEIFTYYDADHIPAAAGAFDFEDKVTTFYAGSCSDVEAYKTADGWKDIPVKKWDGVSDYKWSFAFDGLENDYPEEYWNYFINVNGRPYQYATVSCDNKLAIEFSEPCKDVTFVKWPDNSTKMKEYTATITSDTVIHITLAEHVENLNIALSNPALSSDVAKLYISQGGDWEEKNNARVNKCNSASIKVEILDKEHYYFLGWYDGPGEGAKKVADTEEYYYLDEGTTWYANVQSYPRYVEIEPDPMCWECFSQIDHFEINGVDKGSSSAVEIFDYKDQVSIQFVGKNDGTTRYILDYWADETGNYITDENPYVFSAEEGYYRFRPVIKAASKFTVTAKPSDAAIGTVTMTPEAGAEVETGIFWEGSHIELKADAKADHVNFKSWNDGNTQLIRTVTVRSNFDYVAVFEKDSFNVVIKPNGVAEDPTIVSYTGAGRYGWGDDVTVSCTILDDHYHFHLWTAEKSFSEDITTTFENVGQYKDFEVQLFVQPNEYTITTAVEPAEGGSVKGGGSAVYKELRTLTAIPNEGYEFVEWKEDHETAEERNVPVTGDATYTAIFALKQTPGDPTGVETITNDELRITKVLRDGTMYILRGGKTYDATGRLVE